MKPVLLIGYGNPHRQDDGTAWHVLNKVASLLKRPFPDSFEDGLQPDGSNPDFLFQLQLTPELSETIAGYAYVCFIDAHTGSRPEDLTIQPVEVAFQSSPFTHHLSPESCLALCQTIYQHQPQAMLVTVRGFHFGFSETLSPETGRLVDEAAQWLVGWLQRLD